MTLDNRYRFHQALNMGAVGVFIPIMALYCLEKGLNLYQLGLFFAVFYSLIVLVELPTGGLADKYGRLRIFRISKILDCFSIGILLFSSNISLLLIGSAISGVARSLSSGSLEAWYVERLNESGREKDVHACLGKAGSYILAGMAVGAITGGYLPDAIGMTLYPENKYAICLLAILCLQLINLISISYFYREGESKLKGDNQTHSTVKVIRNALMIAAKNKMIKLLLLGQMLVGFLISVTETFWQPYFQALSGGEQSSIVFGVITTCFFMLGSIASAKSNIVLEKFNNQLGLMLFSMLSICSIMLVALALSKLEIVFALLYILLPLFLFTVGPAIQSYMHEVISDSIRSSTISLFSLSFNIGGMIVGFGLSSVVIQLGISNIWLISASVAFVLSIFLLRIDKLAKGQKYA